MNILFLCTANLNRSKTAERLGRTIYPLLSFSSAGLSEKYCFKYGTTLCTEDMLNQADKVFVMENMHIERIVEHTGTKYLEKIISLEIPDEYKFDNPELVSLLKSKIEHVLSH